MRMDPDGSNHVSVIDLLEFAHGLGGDYIQCWFMTEGYCFFGVVEMVEIDDGDGSDITQHLQGENIGNFYYKIDGSAGEPKKRQFRRNFLAARSIVAEIPYWRFQMCPKTVANMEAIGNGILKRIPILILWICPRALGILTTPPAITTRTVPFAGILTQPDRRKL